VRKKTNRDAHVLITISLTTLTRASVANRRASRAIAIADLLQQTQTIRHNILNVET